MGGGAAERCDGGKANGGEAEGPKFKFDAGVLFGLTAGTQDVAVKLKAAVTF